MAVSLKLLLLAPSLPSLSSSIVKTSWALVLNGFGFKLQLQYLLGIHFKISQPQSFIFLIHNQARSRTMLVNIGKHLPRNPVCKPQCLAPTFWLHNSYLNYLSLAPGFCCLGTISPVFKTNLSWVNFDYANNSLLHLKFHFSQRTLSHLGLFVCF